MQSSKQQATLFRAWYSSKENAQSRNKGKDPINLQPSKPSRAAPSGATASNANAGYVDLTRGAAGQETKEEYGFDDFQELDDFFEDDISETNTCGGGSVSSDRPVSLHNTSILEDVPGFDSAAGEQWTYPTNYPVRDYQFNIVQKCLFRNTLVCLPTGLGKTFIAAVVMFNFYQWYPAGKVVFLAPTKPLVRQQIEACHNIMGISQTHLAEMTG